MSRNHRSREGEAPSRRGGLPAVHPQLIHHLSQQGITSATHEIAYVGRGPYSYGHPTKSIEIAGETVILSFVPRYGTKPLLGYGLPHWDMAAGPWYDDAPPQRRSPASTPDQHPPSSKKNALSLFA